MLIAHFSDGFESPVTVRGTYWLKAVSPIAVGLTHNRAGYARVVFFHDEDLGDSSRALETFDPWVSRIEHKPLVPLETVKLSLEDN